MDPPVKVITPYGGRLVWRLPGGNILIVHLKDKQKIRNKKRWSQVIENFTIKIIFILLWIVKFSLISNF